MAEKSMYSRGGDGMTTGGLDGYLGPEAQDHSNLPEHIENVEIDEDEKAADETVDCEGADRNEAVCEIAKAEVEERKQQAPT